MDANKMNIDTAEGTALATGSPPPPAPTAPMDLDNDSTIFLLLDIPDIPDNVEKKVSYMQNEYKNVIKYVAVQQRKDKEPEAPRVKRLAELLAWLATLEMTPEIKTRTKIDVGIGIILKPEHKFTTEFLSRAKSLLKKWEENNWGAGDVEDEEEQDSEPESTTSPSMPTTTSARTITARVVKVDSHSTISPPPRDHPIFGEQGIMHGVVICPGKSGRRSYRLNPNYAARSCQVFGDNGIQVGTWWPLQIAALFNGAHGSRMGGIAGNIDKGAWSIVISGTYDDLDQDSGDTVFYSGSKSHDNKNPDFADSSRGNRALMKSIDTGNPVRVLRAAKRHSSWAPAVGIRYDGLYRVVKKLEPLNKKGGKYEQFKLIRLPNQSDLRQTYMASPSPKQVQDYNKVVDGY